MLTVPRPEEPADGPGQSLLLQPFVVSDIGLAAAFLSRERLFREGPREHRIRRAEVAIDMRRRERQQRADTIEAVPARVVVEGSGHVDVEEDAEAHAGR